MIQWLRSWWKKKRKPLMIAGITVLLLGFILLVAAGYWLKWDWTGFNEHIGPKEQQYQPAKTLWDWLNCRSPELVTLVTSFVSLRSAH